MAVDNRANMRIMENKNKNSSCFGGVQYAEIRRGDIGRRHGASAAPHGGAGVHGDRKSTRLNSSYANEPRMPSSA